MVVSQMLIIFHILHKFRSVLATIHDHFKGENHELLKTTSSFVYSISHNRKQRKEENVNGENT